MILDTLEQADRYAGLHSRFPQAIAELRKLVARDDLPESGRVDLDGENLFAIIVDAPGRERTDAKLESHNGYIDIQYTASGTDSIGWSPLNRVSGSEGYDESKDVEFYTDAPSLWFDVNAGDFAIFFLDDAHAPLANTGHHTRKIVIKVAV
jgi:biofilm protein TabA